MALDINRGNERTGLLAGNQYSRQVRVGNNELGQAHRDVLTVKNTGRTVSAPNSLHAETNFYIQQSREYFPSKPMCGFCECRCFKTITTCLSCFLHALLITVSCLVGLLDSNHAVMAACIGMSVLAIVCCTPLLCLFCQHCCVVCCTIPTVLNQPVKADLGYKNQHLEVAINSEDAVYMKGRGGVVRVVAQARDTVRIHVLSTQAAERIKRAVCCSVCCCLSVLLLALWAPAMLAVSIVKFTSTNSTEPSS
jgi:hypothetical protein